MMPLTFLRRLSLCFAVVLSWCAMAAAEEPSGTNCPMNDLSRFTVRHARIVDPWSKLRFWSSSDDAAAKAVRELEGKPYDQTKINAAGLLVENRLLPLDLQVAAITVGHCTSSQLDVTFSVISLLISPRITIPNKENPLAKGAPAPSPIRIAPDLGYNATDRFYGGGTSTLSWRSHGVPLSSFVITGYGSSALRWIDAALEGERNSTSNWLAHGEWGARFTSHSSPTTAANLDTGRLSANFFGYTRPVKETVFHFGAMAGGGNDQSRFDPSQLEKDVSASAAYSGLKIYAGATVQGKQQDLTLAYGLELGGAGTSSTLSGWHKQIGNVAYDLWVPVGDHRQIEVEQRLAGGTVGISKSIPVGEMFFGGNSQSFFVPDSSFKFISNPYIRSLPANSFYHSANGAGAESFVSYNLTVAATAWRKPLVPPEVSVSAKLCDNLRAEKKVPPELADKRELCKALNFQFGSAETALETVNAAGDKRLAPLRKSLPGLLDDLNNLSARITSLQTSGPTDPPFDKCLAALKTSTGTVKDAIGESASSAYEDMEDLMPDGDSSLNQALDLCHTALSSASADTTVLGRLQASTHALREQLEAIDQEAAKKASSLMSYAKRLMFQVLSEVNIVSISPVAVFDVAHIGPANSGIYGGTRYGAGPGLRFTIANTANFTAAYAWNANRHVGEDPGAFYFSLTTRNVFR